MPRTSFETRARSFLRTLRIHIACVIRADTVNMSLISIRSIFGNYCNMSLLSVADALDVFPPFYEKASPVPGSSTYVVIKELMHVLTCPDPPRTCISSSAILTWRSSTGCSTCC